MKLNKPLITICLIILLVIDLLFFSFLSFGKKTNDREYIDDIVENFDFKDYLLNNYMIQDSVESYNYPKEVFDYLNDLKIDEVKKKLVNNLFNNEDYLIDKEEIIDILNESVYEFESNKSVDIYKYVEKDIYEFASNLDKRLNEDLVEGYSFISSFTNSFYFLSLVSLVTLISVIIIFEKSNGLLIVSILLMIYSFFVYYFNSFFLKYWFNNKVNFFDNITLGLDSLYIISFIIGIILLIIYLLNCFKKVARNIRINSYNRR